MQNKAILVTPKHGGRSHILGPYTQEEAEKEKQSREGKKIVVSMDFPKPVGINTYTIIEFQ